MSVEGGRERDASQSIGSSRSHSPGPAGQESSKEASGDKRNTSTLSEGKKRAVVRDDDEQFELEEEVDGLDEDEDVHSAVTSEEGEEDVDMDEDLDDVLPNEDVSGKKGKKSSTAKKSKGGSSAGIEPLDKTLPPISELSAIFSDLVSKVQDDLDSVCKRLNGRTLRVGTMCSGTESPLLALGLISDALKSLTGSELKVEHIFSCEIEPFKQAYIERNFSPPLLFRDVTELGGEEALTAYGGRAKVPGNIDILVAGTSCVDYSPLNVKKKTIDAQGESGRTFVGMLDYVVKHMPPIVILENVSNAPWDEVVKKFDGIGYEAAYMRLDTKRFYIPHTRTRGYLLAVPKSSGAEMVDKWAKTVKSLSRPCSSPLEAFLLPTDDPRIHRARQDLAIVKQNKDGVKRTTVDWVRCEQRHALARSEELLGLSRPLTAWQDNGGPPMMPDGTWNDWAATQTERVLDLMDISFLRLAKDDTDVNYKSAIWNLSQNVDRTTASVKLGICPCLTPNMIPYLASRGGPIVGVEALALQGLPIDELLLTRENTDQLADLAGNAMSSTVVGAAILAALAVGKRTFAPGDVSSVNGDVEMKDSEIVDVEKRIQGQDRLVPHVIDLASFSAPPADLFERASQSARKCICEGRLGTSPVPVYRCPSCGHTSCESCRGRPVHQYVKDEQTRVRPESFEADLKAMLPMRMSLAGFSFDELKARVDALALKGFKVRENSQDFSLDEYCQAVSGAVHEAEFHFQHITRRKDWTATFTNDKATLELHLDGRGGEWHLLVAAEPTLAAGSVMRKLLQAPVARLKLDKDTVSLLDGAWDVAIPLAPQDDLKLELETVGELVPSWRAELGLVTYLDEKRPSQIRITSSVELNVLLDRSIDGLYTLERSCGTASNSLHRRVDQEEGRPLYFFLDPSRSGQAGDDPFVFSENCDRLEYGHHRDIVASLVHSWRPYKAAKKLLEVQEAASSGDVGDDANASLASAHKQTVSVEVSSYWTPLPSSKILHHSSEPDSMFNTLSTAFDLKADRHACSSADCLLSAQVKQAAPTETVVWAQPAWHEVDLHHEGPTVLSKIAWMLARIPEWEAFRDWQAVSPENLLKSCDTCCPPPPTIHWIKRTEQKVKSVVTSILAVEDGNQAAHFEQALKARPSPLLLHTRQIEDSFEFRVGLNVATLAHKALGALPDHGRESFAVSEPHVSWRLKSSNGVELGFGRDGKSPEFTLPSNREDSQAPQPPHFANPQAQLRPEQLRSLTWMIAQETAPESWVEEEVAEAVLPQLGWHAEARATRNVTVRGGVLADEVGYGKTAITVGLISSQLDKTELLPDPDRVSVKATLVVIPPHLCAQWPSEIKKFTKGSKEALKVIVIKDVGGLKKNTVHDIMEADIIVIADTVFKSPLYWPQLGDWTASKRGVKYDARASRYFRICVDEALDAMSDQVKLLQNGPDGARNVLMAINASRKAREKMDDIVIEPSKRLKGQAAVFAKEKEAFLAAEAKGQPQKKAEIKVRKDKVDKTPTVPDDPWELGTTTVGADWTKMKAPPLAMFAFNRIVVDEFTYSDGAQIAAIHSVRARSRWILSGTPPLKNFSEVKTIANLLHVHLGVHDESEGSSSGRDARSKERTSAEQFHSFRDVHTAGWHRRRDEVAQAFLNQFARQNLAEIDEIPYEEEIVKVKLPAAEMAIYRELEHHLLALAADLGKIQRMKKDKKGDREVRLSQALGESSTPEEALLKRCAHFSLDMDDETAKLEDAPHVCDQIVSKRIAQLQDCEEELLEALCQAAAQHRVCEKEGYYKPTDARHFTDYLKNNIFGESKDPEAMVTLRRLAGEVGCLENGKVGQPPANAPKPREMTEFLRKNGEPSLVPDDDGKMTKIAHKKVSTDDFAKEKTFMLRRNVSTLQRLTKELFGRYRSKRYFECVRSAQRDTTGKWKGLAILSSCGHHGPQGQVTDAAIQGKCIESECEARVGSTNIVLAKSLGNETQSGAFGVKLETLVNIIKDEIPAKDKILVFVQFDDLFDKVQEALETYDIPTAVLSGTASAKGKVLEKFQDPTDHDNRVLLLRVTDASASGANLTVASWAFFVSPLLTDSRQQYRAFETQAIGRLRRYGQTRKVKVFRLLSDATIDIDIIQERLELNVEKVIESQPPRKLEFRQHDKVEGYVFHKNAADAARKEKKAAAAFVKKEAKAKAAATSKQTKAKAGGSGEAHPAAPAKSRRKSSGRVVSEDDEDDYDATDVESTAVETEDDSRNSNIVVKGKGKAVASSTPRVARRCGRSSNIRSPAKRIRIADSDEEDEDTGVMSVAESSTTAASAAVSKKRTNAASSPLTDVDSLRNKRRKSRSSFAIEIPPLSPAQKRSLDASMADIKRKSAGRRSEVAASEFIPTLEVAETAAAIAQKVNEVAEGSAVSVSGAL